MTSTVIFIGTTKSTLAISRFVKLQEVAKQNNFCVKWFEKRSGAHRIFSIFKLILLIFQHRKATWICHGSYWPELLIHIIAQIRYSVIVQGSELNVNGRTRRKIHTWILSRAYAVGCRTLEQMEAVKNASTAADPFILRMDHYCLPISHSTLGRTKIISVRASSPLYRQKTAANIALQIKNIICNGTISYYLCYNGPDNDPGNELFDGKVIGPVDQLTLSGLLASARCVISVPRTDGLSNVVIESLIQGALIICSEATYKPEFEAFKDRFIIISEKLLNDPNALFDFLRVRLEEADHKFPATRALAVHRKFSCDEKSIAILLGKDI